LERPGDVRKALVETSNGKIGNALDQALLYCFQYDPATNSYVADAWQFTIIIATFVVVLMAGLLVGMWYLERRNAARRADAEER
jgi:protein SCO1/2